MESAFYESTCGYREVDALSETEGTSAWSTCSDADDGDEQCADTGLACKALSAVQPLSQGQARKPSRYRPVLWACVIALFGLLWWQYEAFPSAHHVKAQPQMTRQAKLNDTFFRHGRDGSLDRSAVRGLIRDMFFHGWNNYLQHAYPHDDLAPLSCTGIKSQGEYVTSRVSLMSESDVAPVNSYYLTLIDAADTLAVMGERKAFANAVELISKIPSFDMNVNVSVFETNIRILGGLLSSHIIAEQMLPSYQGRLLELAYDIGNRLLPAFNTLTGIPFGTVRRFLSFSQNERANSIISSVRSTYVMACQAMRLQLSVRLVQPPFLSNLDTFLTSLNVAKRALTQIWRERSHLALLGNHIDSSTGMWTNTASGIAGAIDSFYEYLWKSYLVFHDNDFYTIFETAYNAIEYYGSRSGWHLPIDMFSGRVSGTQFSSLQCFWAGIQASMGDVGKATRFIERLGHLSAHMLFIPELLHVNPWSFTRHNDYPLRPELVESIYFLYQTFKEPGLLEFGTRTDCGFATVQDINSTKLRDHMESFFLAETLKYLYLLFDEKNEFNDEKWVFTTEAHPLPILPQFRRGPAGPARHQYSPPQDVPPVCEVSHTQPPPVFTFPISRRRSWGDRQCDASEWRSVNRWLSMAPPRTGIDWLSDWGYFNEKIPLESYA